LPTLASLACSTTGATLIESAQLAVENRSTPKAMTMIGLIFTSLPHQQEFSDGTPPKKAATHVQPQGGLG
jgi:hypothetical protein